MRLMKPILGILCLVGIALLVLAFFLARNSHALVTEGRQASGTVIALARHVSSSDGRSTTTYRPVVRYVTATGETIEFTSSSGSNPPSYHPGETVEVLYRADSPYQARINGFFSLWGAASICGFMGLLFVAIPGGIWLLGRRRQRNNAMLLRQGVPLETRLQQVLQDTSRSVNGRHPFRVVTQWLDPQHAQMRVFESEPLWYDPSAQLGNRSITVYIERGNPDSYYMDLSFLPPLAG